MIVENVDKIEAPDGFVKKRVVIFGSSGWDWG